MSSYKLGLFGQKTGLKRHLHMIRRHNRTGTRQTNADVKSSWILQAGQEVFVKVRGASVDYNPMRNLATLTRDNDSQLGLYGKSTSGDVVSPPADVLLVSGL